MGGFNFGSEDKILRWLHRGDTLYDVIIPEDAQVVLCNEEKGVWRANKIIVTNPRKITDEFIKEFEEYNKKTEIFSYDELGQDSKIVYDMLIEIRGVR